MKRSLTAVILVLCFTAGCASTGSDRNGDEPVVATGEVSAPLQEEKPEQTEQRDVSEDENTKAEENVSEDHHEWAEPVIEVPLQIIEPSILGEEKWMETVPLPDLSKIRPARKETEEQNPTDVSTGKVVGAEEENAEKPTWAPSPSQNTSGNASPKNDRIASAEYQAKETYSEATESEEDEANEYDDLVLAAIGESIQISLPDHRWVFDRKLSDIQGIEFEDTQYLNTSKEFIFSSDRRGESTLVFTMQNLDTGSVDVTRVRVSVLKLDEKLAALEEQEADTPIGEIESPQFSRELLRQELVNGNMAGLDRQLKLLNSALGNPPEEGAPGNESDELTDIDWKTVIEAAEYLSGSQFEQTAAESLTYLIEKATNEKNLLAQVYFLLGAIYESPPLPRDEREAVLYYRKVMQIYPTNTYYFRAEERIKYLERHFLQIR